LAPLTYIEQIIDAMKKKKRVVAKIREILFRLNKIDVILLQSDLDSWNVLPTNPY